VEFEDMNELQRRLHNAAIGLECDGDEYGYVGLLRETIAELQKLNMQLCGRKPDGSLIPPQPFFQSE
jgi:hypothetical protein